MDTTIKMTINELEKALQKQDDEYGQYGTDWIIYDGVVVQL